MTCREVLDFLMSYLDGELPPDVRAAFESHLSKCPSCVAYLNSYRTTVALGKDAYGEERQSIPEELVQAMLAAARNN
jgi:anti-sigma factor RsiW